MSEPLDFFKVGDYVEVWWTSSSTCLKGHVTNVPGGPGDMWHIKDERGNIHAINPYASNLEAIIKVMNLNTGREKS